MVNASCRLAGSSQKRKNLLDTFCHPPYHGIRVFLTQNLFLICADLMTKFSKKLGIFFGGLHKIIAAACLLNFFYIQPKRASFER